MSEIECGFCAPLDKGIAWLKNVQGGFGRSIVDAMEAIELLSFLENVKYSHLRLHPIHTGKPHEECDC